MDEPVQGQMDPENPWPGLAAYSEQSSTYFYGRGDEVGELLRRVRRHRLTVLFGQSGLGKTSLLNAGLFPLLRSERFLPVPLRLDFSPGAIGLVEQVKTRIQAVIAESGLAEEASNPRPDETLWAYFHRRGDQFRGPDGQLRVLVLVFDQFEEIFTLGESGRTSSGNRFLTELGDLIENRPPTEIEESIEADFEVADQFEYGKDQYRVLLALREDYLAHLEDLRLSMPSLSQNRVRLNRMTDRQAVDAVLGPGADLVSSSLAQAIVRFVSGANSKGRSDGTTRIEVEPSLLSLVCHELNNKRRVLRQSTITPDLLAGSSDAILHDFYERCLADQAPAVRRFVEDQLLTDSGFRENIALERARKLLDQEGAPTAAIDQLIDRRLLHVEERLNVRRVELTHDILTGVVKASRDSRRAREEKEEAERQRELAEDQRRQAEERERRTRRQLRKARMTAAAFGVLLVAALVAVGWAILANKEAKREAKRAVEAEERYQRTAELAQRTADLAQRTAIEARARSLDYNSTIVALVDKMLENAVPEEAGMLRVLRAESLSALGKHREAVDEYKELLKVDPDNVIYSTSLGYEYINVGDSAKALEATNFALAHQEGSVAAFMNKGYLLGAQGDYEGATRAIKAGIELFAYTGPQMYIVQSTISPDIKAATGQNALFVDEIEARNSLYYELANIKAYAGDPGYSDSLKAADAYPTTVAETLFALNFAWRHLENRPEDYGALAAEGSLWERADFKEWAKEYYTRFEQTHAAKRSARYNELATWVAQRLEALRAYKFPNPSPPKISLLVLEAQELSEQGDLGKAIELLDQGVAREPDNIELLIFRAVSFLNAGRYVEAKKDCDTIIARAPRTAVAYFYRAIAEEDLRENTANIEADLRMAIECNPHAYRTLVWLSDLVESRDPHESLRLLTQSVTEGIWFTDIPYIYWRLAYLQNSLRQYKEADEAARIAIVMKSDVLEFYEPLYNAERGLGKSPKDAVADAAGFCRTQAEARSALGQKWNAFNTYWTGFQFLARASQGSEAADVQQEIVSMVSGVSTILESIGSKEQAIAFWSTAANSIKAYDKTLTEDIFVEGVGSKEQAILFWKAVIKSERFKAYNQVFQDEMNRLSAAHEVAAPVQ